MCKYTGIYRVIIPLQKMVSVMVSAHFSIVFLVDRTQEVPLLDLESPAGCSAYFFPDYWYRGN